MKMFKCHKELITQCLKLFAALVAYDFTEIISCVCESGNSVLGNAYNFLIYNSHV